MSAPAATPLASAALCHHVQVQARRAGAEIMAVYGQAFQTRNKADGSPVTWADERAEQLIVPALQALTPGLAVIAEEAASRTELAVPAGAFWLVDPLDGTREFVARNGEFTVNIALIEDGAPVLGVVFVPALDILYAGLVGQGAWVEEGTRRRTIACRLPPPEGLTLACSRSHGDEAAMAAWLQAWPGGRPIAARITAGSSLKFGLIAAGQADIYPRLGPTMEWDTAAGHAVLAAAGGQVSDLQGRPLRYGKPGWRNPHFVARGAG